MPSESEFDKDLAKMQELFSRVRHEYDLFFAGNRKEPPRKEAKELEDLVRKYRNASISKLAQQFRLSTFLSSYSIQNERWGKWMRDREEGVAKDPRLVQAVRRGREIVKELDKGRITPEPQPKQEPATFDFQVPQERSEVEKRPPNPLRELYDEFISAKVDLGEAADVDFKDFERRIQKQREGILEKYKEHDVAFTVAVKDGKVSLKAKVVKRTATGS